MMQTSGLSVGYHQSRGTVLSSLELTAKPGEFICLLGRNGTGKSTLLRTMAGLQPALGGHVLLQGKDIHTLRPADRARRVAVVLTERQFGLGLTVEDAVAMGRHPHTGWRGQLSDGDWQTVFQSLEMCQATPLQGRYLDDLSDGEKQRVMIARAIAQSPHVMLLDEITAFLDLPGRVESMMLLREYARAKEAVVILSSHDLELSMQLADKLWLLDGGGQCIAGNARSIQESGAIGAAFNSEKVVFSAASQQFEII